MASIKKLGKDKKGMTIWAVQYRRTPNGSNVHRRIHAMTKQEVERTIALDIGEAGSGLKWSEGLALYVTAKHREKRNPVGIGHAERAVSIFKQLEGDIAIESTTPEILKRFMVAVANGVTVKNSLGKKHRTSGAGVANHHRKELITVARYIQRHEGKITDIPFLAVPLLPTRKVKRQPIHESLIHAYLDALQPHVRRPVMLVLLYGLRSTAICVLTPKSIAGETLVAVDKGNVERRIPIDQMLNDIIEEANEHRATFPNPADRLFVNKAGLAWNATSLLRAAQRYWSAAGLEKKKIHELRHTLGTLAGKKFSVGMVQAAMGHQSRQSSEVYFHPNEEMAATVRQEIVSELFQKHEKPTDSKQDQMILDYAENGKYTCPCCSANLLIVKKKGRKSK